MPPTVLPRTSIRRPALVATTWLKGSPLSRRLAIDCSRSAAESGASHVRRRRRRCHPTGAPTAAGNLPATSGGSPGRRPGDQPLVVLVGEPLQAIDRHLEVADLGSHDRVLGVGAVAGAKQDDDAEHGEEHRADHRHDHHRLGGIQAVGGVGDAQCGFGAGRHERQDSQERRDDRANPPRFPAMPAHAEPPTRRRFPILMGFGIRQRVAVRPVAHASARESPQCNPLIGAVNPPWPEKALAAPAGRCSKARPRRSETPPAGRPAAQYR